MRGLAAVDTRYPLPDGTVHWLGAETPFANQCAVALRLTNSNSGRTNKHYQLVSKTVDIVTADGNLVAQPLTVLEHWRDCQALITVQVTVTTNDWDPDSDAWEIADRIAGRLDDPQVSKYLRAMGLAFVRTSPIMQVDAVIDDRTVAVCSFDIRFQMSQTVQGLDTLPIERIEATGQVTGGVSTIQPISVEVQKP